VTLVVAVSALTAAISAGGERASVPINAFASLRSAAASAAVSANWAGYAVTGTSTTYTSATATWKEPKVTCGAEDAGKAAAFWVGLGGYSESSEALEQLGTSADCDPTTGRPTYYAWYELVPSPSVTLKLAVEPGDVITTSVNALAGNTIEFQVKNRTRGTSFTSTLSFANPDLTSAEWIAEAPSDCNSFRCRQIPLSDFGFIAFTRIAALGNSVGGTLSSNPGWTTTGITLNPGQTRGFFPGPDTFVGSSGSSAHAAPSAVSADGRSFTVQWSAAPDRGSGWGLEIGRSVADRPSAA
jgi:hypothetical protein